MKKYFMMALAAISAMTITVSCDSDYEPSGFYSEVNVSNSYVSLSTSGGTASTEVYAEMPGRSRVFLPGLPYPRFRATPVRPR